MFWQLPNSVIFERAGFVLEMVKLALSQDHLVALLSKALAWAFLQ
jgi:hypothetical protein